MGEEELKRERQRDLILSVSIANLCFPEVWRRLLFTSRAVVPAYSSADYLAAILNVLLVGTMFFLILDLGRRSASALVQIASRYAPLVVLLIPLNYFREHYLDDYGSSPSVAWGQAQILLGAVSAVILAYWIRRWHRKILAITEVICLGSFPLVVLTFSQAGWRAVSSSFPSSLADRRAPLPSSARKPTTRVLWLLFDEMDQRLTFSERPTSLRLPEIDRLHNEALSASEAYPPAATTVVSMPALMTGKPVTASRLAGRNQMVVTFAGGTQEVDWSSQDNVFSEARQAGFRTALVGWYLPYCRVIPAAFTSCFWQPSDAPASGQSLTAAMWRQICYSLPWEAKRDHIFAYFSILEHAQIVANDPELDLVLVHWPIPHAPAIYDRRAGRFRFVSHNRDWYLDNLALVDRTVGQLRRAMEASGLWDQTTILLTSDHSWRWSANLDGKTDPRVPLILKLARHKEPLYYARPFETLLLHDLLLALLRGELTDPNSVARWLDQRAHPASKGD
ncbi:MAG: sulfatase-like hydrolase/transferase [Acidobacteria bacterium]|nr:sulfatase-like hydrolase/transferase [Acidobacteriota bacterium]